MTFEDLENEFEVTLPAVYRAVLEDVPETLSKPIYKDQPRMGRPCDAWFLTDLAQVALLNRQERAFWPEAEWTRGRSFPRQLFLIGSNDGDQIAINLRKIRLARVVIWKHNLPLGIWLPHATTLAAYIKKCTAKCD